MSYRYEFDDAWDGNLRLRRASAALCPQTSRAGLLLSVWDHVVSNWEFYRERISGESGSTWVSSCSVDSISETPEVPEVILRCPAHPASLRPESE